MILFFSPCMVYATDIEEINELIINGNNNENINENNNIQKEENNISSNGFLFNFLDSKGSPVAGAEFTVKDINNNILKFTQSNNEFIYTNSGYYQTIITDQNGILKVSGLNTGLYSLEYLNNLDNIKISKAISVNVAEGIKKDTIRINDSEFGDVSYAENEETGDGSFEFNLLDQDGNAIPGVEFILLNSNDKEVQFSGSTGVFRKTDKQGNKLLTNSNGNIFLRGLANGTYKFMQNGTIDGFAGEKIAKEFTINGPEPVKEKSTLKAYKGSLMIQFKADNENIDGVFILKNSSEEQLKFSGEAGSYARNNDGVIEIKPSNNYIKLSGLNAGNYTLETLTAPHGYSSVKKENIIIKGGEEAKVDVALEEATGQLEIFVKDESTNNGVQDFIYKIYDKNNEEIYALNEVGGLYNFSKEKTKDAITSDIVGSIIINKIPVGIYKIKQTQASKGYIKNADEETFSISGNETTKIEFSAQRSNAAIRMIDESGIPVSGAKFSINNQDGKRVFSGESNPNGKVLISGVKEGSYTYRIRGFDSPYVNKIYEGEFTIDENGDILGIGDQIIESNKAIIKTNNIEGAYFKITSEDGEYEEELATDSDGEIIFNNLKDGKYTISQTDSPDDYNISKEVFDFEINRDTIEPFEFTVNLESNTIPVEEKEETKKPISKKIIIIVSIILIILLSVIIAIFKTKKGTNKKSTKKMREKSFNEKSNKENINDNINTLNDINKDDVEKNSSLNSNHIIDNNFEKANNDFAINNGLDLENTFKNDAFTDNSTNLKENIDNTNIDDASIFIEDYSNQYNDDNDYVFDSEIENTNNKTENNDIGFGGFVEENTIDNKNEFKIKEN